MLCIVFAVCTPVHYWGACTGVWSYCSVRAKVSLDWMDGSVQVPASQGGRANFVAVYAPSVPV